MTFRNHNPIASGPISAITSLRGRPNAVLVACCLALVAVMGAVTGVNLALKGIAVDLGVSGSGLTWIADAYTVALAALVLPFGAVGDDFGRRRTLLGGTLLFGVAAGLAAICGSGTTIILCRVGMGVGAALIMPATLSTVTATFADEHRQRAVGIWAGIASAGAVIGLLLSGTLLEAWSWRSTFLGTAGLAAISAVLIAWLVPNTRSTETPAPDVIGAGTSAIAIGSVVFGIIQGADSGYGRPAPIAAFVVGLVGLVAFVLYELRRERPMLDPRNFRLAGFGPSAVALTVQFLGTVGFFYVGLQYVELILGFSPLQSAAAFLPMAAVVVPLSALAPRLAEVLGARVVVAAGLGCIVAGFLLMTGLDASSRYPQFLIALLVFSGGLALSATPATNALVAALPDEKQGVASAMNDVTRELGSALGIALLGSLLTAGYRSGLGGLPRRLPALAVTQVHRSPAAGLAVAGDPRLGSLAGAVHRTVSHAFLHGMDRAFVAGAVIEAVGAAYAAFRFPGRQRRDSSSSDRDGRLLRETTG